MCVGGVGGVGVWGGCGGCGVGWGGGYKQCSDAALGGRVEGVGHGASFSLPLNILWPLRI